MKYAIISDVHGSLKAFKSALADAKKRRCSKIVCLGDLTGYGAESDKCVALAMTRTDVCLMGNHDSACCGKEDPYEVASVLNNYQTAVEDREKLTEEQMAWLSARPYCWNGPGFACVHAEFSAPEEWGYIKRPSDAWRSLWSRNEQILFCGHTHIPVIMEQSALDVKKSRSFDEETANAGMRGLKALSARSCKVAPGARYVVNVGSVGLPRRESAATYAIFDTTAKKIEFITLSGAKSKWSNAVAKGGR